ncbi:MAG TPA: hypothetical protein VHX36_01525 [Candidatus Acidoferrales bacterium]|jgi:hypothetical protein|nr:hypothetical protein [Candidatus Acidoferrales bacterium]
MIRHRWSLQVGVLSCALSLGGFATAKAQVFARAFDAAGADSPASKQSQPAPVSNQSNSSSQQSDQGQNGASKPSLMTPLKPVVTNEPYHPITGRQRLRWIITNTMGPEHLAGGVITSGFGTALDRPREDGPHWGGFAERFGVRLTGVATSNVMEAGVGALWGEDPRYFRSPDEPFGARVKSVIKQTFTARRSDGHFAPAYARYIAYSGSNFLANTWRPDSEANNHDAVLRTLEGFAGRMSSNAWDEFWPDAKAYLFHHHH